MLQDDNGREGDNLVQVVLDLFRAMGVGQGGPHLSRALGVPDVAHIHLASVHGVLDVAEHGRDVVPSHLLETEVPVFSS